MKLNEIFDVDRNPDNIPDEKTPRIGQGAFSSVYTHPDDPHMIVKRTGKKHGSLYSQDKAYNTYIEKLVASEAWKSNPCFPRVYVKANKNDIDNYVIERLVSWSELSLQELMAVIERYYKLEVMENMVDFDKINTPQLAHSTISVMMGRPHVIKSKSLQNAMMFIREIIEESNHTFFLDLGGDNSMYRRTPHGLQIVITDPIA